MNVGITSRALRPRSVAKGWSFVWSTAVYSAAISLTCLLIMNPCQDPMQGYTFQGPILGKDIMISPYMMALSAIQ
jgi:hypothetical protein